MNDLLKLQKQLVPDLLEIMKKRYRIIKTIQMVQPIGRRPLADMLGLTERVLRAEAEFLKEQSLIEMQTAGMKVTDTGRDLIIKLDDTIKEISGLHKMERELQNKLQIADAVIVPGDSDAFSAIKEELGRACAGRLKGLLAKDSIVAVTGGTTMACTADMLTPEVKGDRSVLFVPARGGVGDEIKNQANVICARMAENTGGSYRVLYVPDQVSREVRETFLKDPSIKEVLELIRTADIVLHGIGDALKMAKRRNTSEEQLNKLVEGQAVGEAFGYYFNIHGEIIHKVPTIGLQLEDLKAAEHVIAVAGGRTKARAIRSYMKNAPRSTMLVTDEAAARGILEEEIKKEET